MSEQRPYQFEVKSIDEPARSVLVRLSDATKDLMREVIPLSAWKQPFPDSIPVNWAHDNSRPAIARGRNIHLRSDGVYAALHFPPRGISPDADLVFDLLKLGILTDVSVEFLGRREGDTYVEAELLAVAVCNIGANRRAQVVARALGFGAALGDAGDGDAVVLEFDDPDDALVVEGRPLDRADVAAAVRAGLVAAREVRYEISPREITDLVRQVLGEQVRKAIRFAQGKVD